MGDSSSPKGHALIYFRDDSDTNQVCASYVVMLPVTVDISKYIPPFLAGQVEQLGSGDMSSFAFPPAPEPVPSETWLQDTAAKRGDDLLYGGTVKMDDVTSLMSVVADIASEYGSQYESAESMRSDPELHQGAARTSARAESESTPNVNDVMYSLMSEPDLLTELTTLMGRLQYEVSGGDESGAQESEIKIRAIAKHIPENRRIDLLVAAATEDPSKSGERAQLYLERAYALYREDYTRVHVIEQQLGKFGGSEDETTGSSISG